MNASDTMKKAIESIVVPLLRQKGFTGWMPHFRRALDNEIHVITFQFSQKGDEFVVHLGKCPSGGVCFEWGTRTPPSKVTAWDCGAAGNGKSVRLGVLAEGKDVSFRFADKPAILEIYEEFAKQIIPYLDKAFEWWESEKLSA